jgi:hypothetical protein
MHNKDSFNNNDRFRPLSESITNKETAEGALDFVAGRAVQAGLPREDAIRVIDENYLSGAASSQNNGGPIA